MNSGSDSSRLMSDINVTPFVDVMLVLLIIFMVTAPMMVQGVGVDLPEATSEPLSSKSDPLVVTIDATGQVFINDVSVDPDNLNEKLAKILERRSDREVFLRADQGIPYGAVVRIMAEIKGAGVEKLGMVTTPIMEDPSKTTKR